MTEQVEFEVSEAGSPNLSASTEQPVQQELPLQQTGWTPEEASSVVGGMISNLTLVMYAMRWKSVPPVELLPAIAGNPKEEFPMLGISLAPILDMLAPKGGAASVGVSLSAGIGEIVGAVARRAPIINTPPKQQAAPAPPPQAATPQSEGGGFKFNRDQMQVLQDPYQSAFGFQ